MKRPNQYNLCKSAPKSLIRHRLTPIKAIYATVKTYMVMFMDSSSNPIIVDHVPVVFVAFSRS